MNFCQTQCAFNSKSLFCMFSTDARKPPCHRGNRNWIVKSVLTPDYIHVLGLNTISVNMALSYAVARFHHFCRMNTKIHRYHVPFLFGQLKMWAMKSAPYRLHSHLKMALERKNKMLKVGKQLSFFIFKSINSIEGFEKINKTMFTGNPTTSTMDGESIKSVCIKQTIVGMECTYAVACKGANDSLSYCTQFDPNGNGDKLWKDLSDNGKLTEASLDEKLKGKFLFVKVYIFIVTFNRCYIVFILNLAKDVGVAICGQIKVAPQSNGDLEFALAWDMPKIQFHKKMKEYTRQVLSTVF